MDLIVKNKHEEGIKKLQIGLQRGILPRTVAILAFTEICINENRHEKAIKYLEDLLKKHSQSRILLWQYAEVLKRIDRKGEAIEIYVRLLEHYMNDPEDDGSIVLKTQWKMAELYYKMGEYTRSKELLNFILEEQSNSEVRKKQNIRIRKAEELLKKLE